MRLKLGRCRELTGMTSRTPPSSIQSHHLLLKRKSWHPGPPYFLRRLSRRAVAALAALTWQARMGKANRIRELSAHIDINVRVHPPQSGESPRTGRDGSTNTQPAYDREEWFVHFSADSTTAETAGGSHSSHMPAQMPI